MRRHYFGAILAGAAVMAGACKGDPTSSLRAGPASLSITPSVVIVPQTRAGSVVLVVHDAQLNPVVADASATSADPSVATVAADTSRPYPDGATHAFLVSAAKPDGGTTTVTFSSGSLDTTAIVYLSPTKLTGAVSTLTPQGGSVLTLSSTSLLKLSKVTGVTFGVIAGTITSATTDAVSVIVPFSDPGTPAISGVYTTYLGSTRLFNVTSSSTVTQTGSIWAGDGSDATAPVLTLPATTGKVVQMITPLYGTDNHTSCVQPTAQGPCMFYQFTVADSTKLKFSVGWDGDPADSTDINLFGCSTPYNAATCLTSPPSSDSSGIRSVARDTSHTTRPANFTVKFAAGTYFIVVERKATKATLPGPTVAPRNFRWTITHQ